MISTLYAIRHIATKQYMPQLRGKGYSYWNPSSTNPINDIKGRKNAGVPRLFPSSLCAKRAITAWAYMPNARMTYRTGYFGEEDYDIIDKPDGRKKEDLEIVEVRIKIKGPGEPYWSDFNG